jgi:nucleotide-binding universal stress UspA family protein
VRILVALDGSPSSLAARDLVAGLGWPAATAITLVTALDIPIVRTATGTAAGGDWITDARAGLRKQAEEALAAMRDPLAERGWAVDQRVVEGRPATAILSAAADVDADLIVVGSRGLGTIRSMVLGSVSAEVLRHTDRSVLVARGAKVSRALVATDGSDEASALPDVLADWGILRGLEAVAISVAPVDSPAFQLAVSLYTMGDESIERQREELLELHRGYAARLAERLAGGGISSTIVVARGDAAREILAAAVQHRADLIVTGSRGLRGVDRWLLGSVARNVVVHAEASVLIVRPGLQPNDGGAVG